MLWMALVAVALVALVASFVISRGRIYRPLFTPQHYEEVAQLLVTLRDSAFEELSASPPAPDSNPPAAVTSAGLALSYSITREGGHYNHHLAISLPTHMTPHAVGDRFALFVANRLGIPAGRVRLGAARSTVHHMEFDVDQTEHTAIAARSIRAPSERELEALNDEFNKRVLLCHPIDVPPAA